MGFLAACALALLSYARVSFVNGKPKLTYRQSQVWGGQETLLITESGFPFPHTVTPSNGSAPVYADPNGLGSLADFYARIATSDAVRIRVARKLDLRAPIATPTTNPGVLILPRILAAPVLSSVANQGPLPMLQISGQSSSPSEALAVARAAGEVFQSYINAQQARAGVPAAMRVRVTVINSPDAPLLVTPRKKTLPILVFVTVVGAILGTALILERMRPRVRVVEQRPAARESAAA